MERRLGDDVYVHSQECVGPIARPHEAVFSRHYGGRPLYTGFLYCCVAMPQIRPTTRAAPFRAGPAGGCSGLLHPAFDPVSPRPADIDRQGEAVLLREAEGGAAGGEHRGNRALPRGTGVFHQSGVRRPRGEATSM